MQYVRCKNCNHKISLLDLRSAHFYSRRFSCPNCPRTWEFEQIDRLLNSIDARRLRAELNKSIDKGTSCPCCGQFAKKYRRRFNSIMACWLIAFYRAHLNWPGEQPLHIEDVSHFLHSNVSVRSGDYAKARFWELLLPAGGRLPSCKKSTGLWRLTDKGREFVRGSLTIPRCALVYDNEPKGFEGDQINISDALGDRFNYEDLMSIPPPFHL